MYKGEKDIWLESWRLKFFRYDENTNTMRAIKKETLFRGRDGFMSWR